MTDQEKRPLIRTINSIAATIVGIERVLNVAKNELESLKEKVERL